MKRASFAQITHLLAALALMAGAAMLLSGRFLGKTIVPENDETETVAYDGDVTVVNTTLPGSDIIGYAGPTPLEVRLRDGKIESVTALPNSETTSFMERASDILDSWNGMTPSEAIDKEVDAVSGATFTSNALIQNARLAFAEVEANSIANAASGSRGYGHKAIIALIVTLSGAILPLIIKDKRYRIAQMILNVAILGFWTATFLNYTLMLGYLSFGVTLPASLAALIMLVTAFVYPLFGKKQHYCSHICPLGSVQQLAGLCNKRKYSPGAKTVKFLNILRNILWAVLTAMLYAGVFTQWIDYEPFSAFMLASATPAVLIIAIAVVALSFVMNRPYCRFVCPTGTLFKVGESE